jgi:beta-lactamase regulating signal transducer with metallopeptidase domain
MRADFPLFAVMVVIQVTVVGLVARLMMGLLTRTTATRYAVGVAGIFMVLVSPAMTWVLPTPAWWTSSREGLIVAPSVVKIASVPDEASDSLPSAAPVDAADGGDALRRGKEKQAAGVAPEVRVDAATLLTGVWLVGVVVGLVRWGRGWRYARQLGRSLSPLPLADDLRADLRAVFGVKKLPTMTVSEFTAQPMVLGVVRPVVVVPTVLTAGGDRRRLGEVLIHECAHVVRRDPWINAAEEWASLIYWFHPLVHGLRQQSSEAREELCDNYVLRSSSPADYAQTLLDLARGYGASPRFAVPLGMLGHRRPLELRISSLLDPRRSRATRSSPALLAGCLAALIVVSVLVGGVVEQKAGAVEPPQATVPVPAQEVVATEPLAIMPRSDTPAGRILAELEVLNRDELKRLEDEWLATLKRLADLGEDAVPEILAELDRTQDNMMLRCCGFVARPIGDKRLVPALIRAIPKTLVPSCSDYGLLTENDELADWAQKWDVDRENEGREYGFRRPLGEVVGSLRALTGQRFSEGELWWIHSSASPLSLSLQQTQFDRVARQWADWWEANAPGLIDDPAYHRVKLETPTRTTPTPFPPGQRYQVVEGMSGLVVQPAQQRGEDEVFHDLDTGRQSGLPRQWAGRVEESMDEILAWAAGEGFDIMGLQFTSADGATFYVLREIGMQVWELPAAYWRYASDEITFESLQQAGWRVEGNLIARKSADGDPDPAATAPFLCITREGSPVLLFVGVSILNKSPLKFGRYLGGDLELQLDSPFHVGRRLGMSVLVPKE